MTLHAMCMMEDIQNIDTLTLLLTKLYENKGEISRFPPNSTGSIFNRTLSLCMMALDIDHEKIKEIHAPEKVEKYVQAKNLIKSEIMNENLLKYQNEE